MAKISAELLHYFHNKELDEFYISVALRNFADTMINIFVPIYLFTLGYEIREIAIFFAVHYVFLALSYFLAFRIVSRLGVKKMMSLSCFLLIIYYITLQMLKSKSVPFLLPAIINSLSVSSYYSGYHIEFSKALTKREEGVEYGILKALIIVSTALGPIAGALLISFFSFKTVFTIASLILISSILPLFFTRDFKVRPPKISLKEIVKSDTKEKAIAYQVDGILSITSGIFWPLFIFLAIGGVLELGSIVSITSIIIAILSIGIGKLSDKSGDRVLTAGVFPYSFSWILRLFFLSSFGIFLMNLFSSIFKTMIEVPFYKIIYTEARKSRNIANYFLFRELNLLCGRIPLFIIAILTGSIVWTFILSFFVTFFYLVLRKRL